MDKFYIMKMVSEWFEAVVDNVTTPNKRYSLFIVVLLVLMLGAGSLYMLLNAPA